ncbi:MAG: ATP-dependent DNA ligase [bacterium]|nr:ATP-dependent DNA ligase [bacterium]
MHAFAETAERIAATAPTLEKLEILAAYLRTLGDDDLAAATLFFSGSPFAPREQRALSLGWSAIRAAAAEVWEFSAEDLSAAYRRHGDTGAAIAEIAGKPRTLGLFSGGPPAPPAPAALRQALGQIAAAAGSGAQRRRVALFADVLRDTAEPAVVKYVVKICTGELRIGLREGLIVDALARAFGRDAAQTRRAAAAAGDLGAVAVAARHDALDRVEIAYFSPLQFMLASPLLYGGAYEELAENDWLIEEKYDGVRAQAHVHDGQARIYSRNMNDVTAAYPEVHEALAALPAALIIDGEIVAQRDGRVLPFRVLQTRLQRKQTTAALTAETPVALMAFDLLAVDGRFLIGEPLAERRRILTTLLPAREHLRVAPARRLDAGAADMASVLHEQFESARERGNEGLMLKRLDAPYQPGKRGGLWLKLKRELSTLDCVVVAVEFGHGKRAHVISDYTFAVRAADQTLATIGKAYSGLTDAEIAELTPWFLAHRSGGTGAPARRFPVEPRIVIEVAFDVIQPSGRHGSGYALRFPRIARLRPDRSPADASTLAEVEAIYAQMLAREAASTLH